VARELAREEKREAARVAKEEKQEAERAAKVAAKEAERVAKMTAKEVAENDYTNIVSEVLEDWRNDGQHTHLKVWATPTKTKRLLSVEPKLNAGRGRRDMAEALQKLGLKSRKRPNGTTEYLLYDPKAVDAMVDAEMHARFRGAA
jgi:hypothetical protein